MAIDFDHTTPEEAAWLKNQFPAPYAKKLTKYRSRPTRYKGIRYDSKAEAEYAAELDLDPAVKWVIRQVAISLGQDFKTRVDFMSGSIAGDDSLYVCAHEVKGVETREFRKVRQLWPKYGPFDLWVVKKGTTVEIIHGK